jgi:hypothetical protein
VGKEATEDKEFVTVTDLLISIHLPSLRKYDEIRAEKRSERKIFIDRARADEKNGAVQLHILSIEESGKVSMLPAGVFE